MILQCACPHTIDRLIKSHLCLQIHYHTFQPRHPISCLSLSVLLLPDSKPPLHPPPSDTILSNVISRVFHVLLTPLLCLPYPLQSILLPFLDLLLFLQSLLLHELRLVCYMHLVNVDKAARRLPRVTEELFARGNKFAVDSLRHEVHIPGGDSKGDENALELH